MRLVQAQALDQICRTKQDHLVVLGCEQGKSDIIIALSLLIQYAAPTLHFHIVVVVPYVAVLQEWRNKLERLHKGFYHVLQTSGDVVSVETKIVLVAIERVDGPVMDSFLAKSSQLVQMVVLDEAHAVIQDASFRPCMNTVKDFICRVRRQVVFSQCYLSADDGEGT